MFDGIGTRTRGLGDAGLDDQGYQEGLTRSIAPIKGDGRWG